MYQFTRSVVLLAVMNLLIVSCGNHVEEKTKFELSSQPGMETVSVLETTQGEIVFRFLPDKAPEHVKSFVEHCGSGFYDGTYFHRVAPGYLIQGGDPLTKDGDTSNDGTGGYSYRGPGTSLSAEISDVPQERGTVSMARSSGLHSAGSQFFIMTTRDASLDGKYTTFAEVIEGIEVVDKIAERKGAELLDGGGFAPFKRQYLNHCRLEVRPVVESDDPVSEYQ